MSRVKATKIRAGVYEAGPDGRFMVWRIGNENSNLWTVDDTARSFEDRTRFGSKGDAITWITKRLRQEAEEVESCKS